IINLAECTDYQGRRENLLFPETTDDCNSVNVGKHPINRHHRIFTGTCAPQAIVTFGSEIDLITARCKQLEDLFGRLTVILDDENAASPASHAFASPNRPSALSPKCIQFDFCHTIQNPKTDFFVKN